jgi:hypothetical protein
MIRRPLVGLVVGAIALGAPVGAAADVGAGVGASPVVLASVARPGHTYQLPALYVVNTGTVVSSYRVRVEPFSTGRERTVPGGWVRFDRNDFPLRPKESTSVPMTLAVPSGAPTGNYMSDLVVGTIPTGSGTAVLGAQAATHLQFRVGGGANMWWSWPWWVYAIAAMVLALGAVAVIQRHFGFRVHVDRRR